MASEGPKSAGTGANVTGVGTIAWSSPTNIVSSNDTWATAALNGTTSNWLQATNFGHTIPASATIVGQVFEFEKHQSGTLVKDSAVRMVIGGAIGTADRADTATGWSTSGDAFKSYGGATDVWDVPTVAQVNASDFGVALSAVRVAGAASTARVDFTRSTVYYLDAGVPKRQTRRPRSVHGIGSPDAVYR